MRRILMVGACLAGMACGARIATSDLADAGRETKPMRTEANSPVVLEKEMSADFVVVGGGLSGICAAISAARHGTKTVLVQDRPMLGGNCSSEMRMGIMGAHGDDNKEAGILEELQLRNFYYNPLMRYTLWDDVMYATVVEEKNITLLLNTSVDGVEMDGGRIVAVKAWNGNAYTRWKIRGKLFADCSGDGILRLSGAKFRIGREFPEEFGEDYTQVGGDHRTMGNSILLQLRKTEEHHPFHAPSWAYKFTDEDFVNDKPPKEKKKYYSYKRLYPDNNNFWWIEFGGNIDTIGDANLIQYELKRIAYGVWDYMKNHPDGRCKNYDLDWIGSLPGKRESTRFVGPHILTQHDVMAGGHFEDVVAYGGWSLDDHHPDAFWKVGHLSEHHKCPSPFGIPFDLLHAHGPIVAPSDGDVRHDGAGGWHGGGDRAARRARSRGRAQGSDRRAAGHARGRRLHAAVQVEKGLGAHARRDGLPREREPAQRHRPQVEEGGQRRVGECRRRDARLFVGVAAARLGGADRVRLQHDVHRQADAKAGGGARAQADAEDAREGVQDRRARRRRVEDGVQGRPQHHALAQGLVPAGGRGRAPSRRDGGVGRRGREGARLRSRRAVSGGVVV